MLKLEIPAGKSLYYDAPFDVRRRLQETFDKFSIGTPSQEVVGESLLRLERVQRKAKKRCRGVLPDDLITMALFQMLQYFKSLQ
jgi:hypothetical protein